MSFGQPQLLWLLLLAPALAALSAWIWRRRATAEAAWVARALWGRLRRGQMRPLALNVGLPALAVALLVSALARPRWGETTQTVERQGVDIVFVLDTSRSMAVADVAPTRLWVAQSMIRRLAAALPGHRVALVQAEGTGVVLSPLTTDTAVLDLLLDGVEAGSAPIPGTRLEPALERALKLFPEGGHQFRALVVLSDGEVHGESLAGIAAKLKEAGITVHAVAVGTTAGGPVPTGDATAGYKRDREGKVVVSRLEEDSLAALVKASGGTLIEARNANSDPGPIVAQIRRMETRAIDSQTVTSLGERFQWPLALALLALGLAATLSPFTAAPPRRREEES